jgi:PKD domain
MGAGPAHAADWTVPSSIGGGAAGLPVVTVDALGSAAFAYQLGDEGVAAAFRPAGGPFASAVTSSPDGERPAIAANATGATIAGWTTEADVMLATGSTTAGLSSGSAVPGPGDGPTEVSVGIDDAGNRWLAWIDDGGTVRAYRHGDAGSAGVSSAGAETPRMAVAPGGAATLVWVRRTETTPGGIFRVVTRIERGAPGSAPVVLETATQDTDSDDVVDGAEVSEPQIVAGPGGPTVVWQREDIDSNDPDDEDDDVLTDSVRASLDGGGAQTLGSSTSGIGAVAVDEAGNGTAVVAWDESDGLASAVRAAIRPAGAGFGTAETVATGGALDAVTEARAAVRASGQPLVLWLRGFQTGDVPVDRLDAAVRGAGGWEAAVPPGDLDAEAPALAADGEGNVVATWTAPTGAGGDREARVAAYDAAGPRLGNVSIPDTGRPGDTLAFSAAATDTWSGVAGLHWDFGDGATADGADVDHAYASSGDYDVTLTATDGEGNASAATSVLRVSEDGTPPPPPPPPAPPKDTTAPVVSGLDVSPRCIAPGALRSLSASFDVSENARMLYSIRRRQNSLVRRRCPGVSTHKSPGTSEDAGSRQDQVAGGHNAATIAGARLRRGAIRGLARHGINRVRFAQLLTGLRPGTYQLIVRATDAAGNRSVDQIIKFWVLAPKRNG